MWAAAYGTCCSGRRPKDYRRRQRTHVRSACLELFPGSNLVGAHFGVVIVTENGVQVEVATFRRDARYIDGRRPPGCVAFENGSGADVLRRDFTINALMLDPETGQVLDFVGGEADLRERV